MTPTEGRLHEQNSHHDCGRRSTHGCLPGSADRHAGADSIANCDRLTDAKTNFHADANRDTNADADTDCHAETNADANRDTNADADSLPRLMRR